MHNPFKPTFLYLRSKFTPLFKNIGGVPVVVSPCGGKPLLVVPIGKANGKPSTGHTVGGGHFVANPLLGATARHKPTPTNTPPAPSPPPTATAYAKLPQLPSTLNPPPIQPPLDNTNELLRQKIALLSPTVARLFPHLVSNNHIAFLLQALAVQTSVGVYNAPKHHSPDLLLEAWTLTVHETLNELHRIHSFCSQHPLSNPTPQIEAILTETANTLSWLATSGLPTFLQTRSYSPYQASRL